MNKSGRKHHRHIRYTKIFLASIPTRTSLTSMLTETSLGSRFIFIFDSLNVFYLKDFGYIKVEENIITIQRLHENIFNVSLG